MCFDQWRDRVRNRTHVRHVRLSGSVSVTLTEIIFLKRSISTARVWFQFGWSIFSNRSGTFTNNNLLNGCSLKLSLQQGGQCLAWQQFIDSVLPWFTRSFSVMRRPSSTVRCCMAFFVVCGVCSYGRITIVCDVVSTWHSVSARSSGTPCLTLDHFRCVVSTWLE